MIILDKNIVECNAANLHEIKNIGDNTLYNMIFLYKIKSEDGLYQYQRSTKSLVIKSDVSMWDLMDIINDADENDIRQIIELLIYYLEKGHYLAKSKI